MKPDDCRSCDAYRPGDHVIRHYCELDLPGFPHAGTDCDCYCYAPGSDVDEDSDDE